MDLKLIHILVNTWQKLSRLALLGFVSIHEADLSVVPLVELLELVVVFGRVLGFRAEKGRWFNKVLAKLSATDESRYLVIDPDHRLRDHHDMVVIRIFIRVKQSIGNICTIPSHTQRSWLIDALQLLISFGCTSLLGIPFAINLISDLALFLFARVAFVVVVVIN